MQESEPRYRPGRCSIVVATAPETEAHLKTAETQTTYAHTRKFGGRPAEILVTWSYKSKMGNLCIKLAILTEDGLYTQVYMSCILVVEFYYYVGDGKLWSCCCLLS